jgi:hypothetical protein
MDAVTFLKKILPGVGKLFLAVEVITRTGDKVITHEAFGDGEFDDVAEAALKHSAQGKNVFHVLASRKDVHYTNAGKPSRGKADNIKALKAFWLDVDVAKDGSYATQREAASEVLRFCTTVGLPAPMLVSSGRGLHTYWPLKDAVSPELWFTVASQLKSVCIHLGLKADHVCTSDANRVLRPVGTTNYKYDKPVRLLRDADPVHEGDIAAVLNRYIIDNHVSHTRRDPTPSKNAALMGMGEVEYPPSYAEEVVKHCPVVQTFRDSAGNVSEPVWYAVLGVLKNCEDGETFAHEWGAGHPSYSHDDTQRKLEQWAYGPTSCSKLSTAANSKACESCKHNGKITSPIQLGHRIEPPQVVEVVTQSNEQAETLTLPEGFSWRNGQMHQNVPDKDGVYEEVAFSDTLFYATSRVRGEDGTWNLRIRMSVANHYWREFDLPQMLIPDPRGLSKYLAQYEIIIFGAKHAMDLMKAYVNQLCAENYEVVTYDRYGWDQDRDKFIVGDTAFLANGDTEEVLVTDNVRNSGKAHENEPKGDLDEWVRLMDLAYNRPDAEKYQFVIAAGFASPLVPLCNFHNYRGIPIVLSGEGGVGKSSVCEAAATIYGDPKMLMTNAGSEGGSTLNALFALASMYNGVPLLFDEITQRDSKDFVPLMYTLSNGIVKSGLMTNGKFRETAPPFAGIYFGTSNINITDILYDAAKKDVSDATSARCFEIGGLTKREIERVFGGTNMKDLLEHKLFHIRGVAAKKYLPYVMQNADAIRDKIAELRAKLGSNIAADSRERFYVDTIAFAHVAAVIAKKLGLIQWDVNAMTKWALQHVQTLRRAFTERHAMIEDNIGMFLSWLYNHTIITRSFPIGRKPRDAEVETVSESLKANPCARIAIKDSLMYVAASAVTEWCRDRNIVPTQFKQQLKEAGYIIGEDREYLGKGTNIPTGRVRVYEFNFAKATGGTAFVTDGNVTRIVRDNRVHDESHG